MSVLKSKIVKTKKEHHCYNCKKRITKGSQASYDVVKTDECGFQYGHRCTPKCDLGY